MIKSRIIDSDSGFLSLREDWNALLSRSTTNEFFLKWEWVYAWWDNFKKPDDILNVILLLDEDELVGIAPFMISEFNYYGFKMRKLCFIGEGASDRADVFVARDHSGIFRELFNCIYDRVPGWDIIYLREVPEGSLFLQYMKEHSRKMHVEPGSKCPYFSIDEKLNWESFYKGVSKKLKRDFANKINRLSRLGSYRYENIIDPVSVDNYIDEIGKIESLSFKADRDVALCFDTGKRTGFQKNLVKESGGDYKVVLSLLKLEDHIIAYLYGFVYNNRYHAYNMAYLPDYIRVSPGKLLMNETVKWVIDNRYEKFDFLRGESYIKSKWTMNSAGQANVTIYNDSMLNTFIQFLVFKIRPLMKKMRKISCAKHEK